MSHRALARATVVASRCTGPLEALLELTRSAGEDPLPMILATVAEMICEVGGYQAVVINIYRPE